MFKTMKKFFSGVIGFPRAVWKFVRAWFSGEWHPLKVLFRFKPKHNGSAVFSTASDFLDYSEKELEPRDHPYFTTYWQPVNKLANFGNMVAWPAYAIVHVWFFIDGVLRLPFYLCFFGWLPRNRGIGFRYRYNRSVAWAQYLSRE